MRLINVKVPTPDVPKFATGDECWHQDINQKVTIIRSPQYSNGRFSYLYEFINQEGRTQTGQAPEALLVGYKQIEKFNDDQQLLINCVPSTPIKKLIESLAASLPGGDEIKKEAGTFARLVKKEKDRTLFENKQHFVSRMNAISEKDALWNAIADRSDFTKNAQSDTNR